MGNKYRILVAIAGVVTIGIIASLGLAGAADPDLVESLSLLGEPQTAHDQLPPVEATEHFVAESARLVYESDTATHWAGANDAGEICFATRYSARGTWAVASTCSHPAIFAAHGKALSVFAVDRGSDVTFLPDGFASEKVRSQIERAGGTMPVDNLVVFPWGERPDTLTVKGLNGVIVEFGRPAEVP